MRFEYITSVGCKIPIAENYKDCVELIRSDYYRMRGKDAPLVKMFFYTFIEPSFSFLFWFRLSSYKTKSPLYFISKFIHRHLEFKYALMIPSSTLIGYGFYIGHPAGIIINPSAIIGNNVNISQFTTIGANRVRAAVVGDNVYIGPSTCLIENVKIGSGATIGAGSIVTKDIPANSVAVGNPTRIIETKTKPGEFINNKWMF